MRLKGKDVYTSESDRRKQKQENRFARWSMGVDYSSKIAYPILCVVMAYYFITECICLGGKQSVLNQLDTLNKVSMIALIIATVGLAIWSVLFAIDSIMFLVRHVRETSDDDRTFSYFFFEMLMTLLFLGTVVIAAICIAKKYYVFSPTTGADPEMFGAMCGIIFCITTFNFNMESVDQLDVNIMKPSIASAVLIPAGIGMLVAAGKGGVSDDAWYSFLAYFGIMNAIMFSGILCILMVYGVCYRIKTHSIMFRNAIARTFGLICFIISILVLVFYSRAIGQKGPSWFVGGSTLVLGIVAVIGFILNQVNGSSNLNRSFVHKHMARTDDEDDEE